MEWSFQSYSTTPFFNLWGAAVWRLENGLCQVSADKITCWCEHWTVGKYEQKYMP